VHPFYLWLNYFLLCQWLNNDIGATLHPVLVGKNSISFFGFARCTHYVYKPDCGEILFVVTLSVVEGQQKD